MPFSKYVVDPAHIEAMRSAFRKVCDSLRLSCDANDPVTEMIVMKIVELTKAGELDPDRLCSQVLLELAGRSDGGRPGSPISHHGD
jgi:hypothetical protein